MWWLVRLLWTVWLTSVLGMEDIDIKEIEAMFHEAALEVYREQTDEMSRLPQPPAFNMPGDFMRSYLPNTGIGNREELLIGSIYEMPVFSEEHFTQFRYKRFNHTDYIMAAHSKHVFLGRRESAGAEHFVLAKDDAVFNFVPDYWSTVKDIMLFTRFVKRSSILYAAILTESAKNSRVNIYEIVGNKGVPGAFIDLGISPSNGQSAVVKFSYVQSQYGESLVILINSPDIVKTVYQQKGSSELNHYIEVYYPNPIDLVTFTVHGHGYIAVGNVTTTNVFKMDEFARSDLLFDRLTVLSDLVDLEYFRLGFHHYLMVSGRNEQYLYVWKSAEFSLKQVLKQYNVNQVYSSTLPTCRDDVILIIIEDEVIDIYVYDGRKDLFERSNAAIPPKLLQISPGSITSFAHENKAVLLFSANGKDVLGFVIEASLKALPNPFLTAGEEVYKKMKNIQEMMEDQTRQLLHIKNVLKNAVRMNGDQIITAFQSFKLLHSKDNTVVSEIKEPVRMEWDGSSLTLDEYKKGTKMLEQKIAALEELVQEMEQVIPDIVLVDKDAIITGAKRFTGDVSGSSILALSVKLHSAAGVNVRQLQKDVYRLDKPQQIKGTLTFEKPLTIEGNLDIETTLNGIDISKDVMTTDTKQSSNAEMIFKNKLTVTGDLQITGKLNGISIRNEVVTLDGSHHISAKKSFLNGIIAKNVDTVLLDGMNISDVYHRSLTKSGNQEVPGTKTFSAGLVSRNIILHGLLNGYNISELAEDIVRIDRPSYIKGHKTFTGDVAVKNSLTVGGRINGLHIPGDLFLTDIEQTVPGNKVFTGTVTAQKVIVSGTVDDLNFPDDVVTLSRNEEVSSTLYFTEGINVENDIIVEGWVDGVDLSEVAKEALKLNESSEFKDAVFVGDVTIKNNLQVGGTVNKIDLDHLVEDIIFKDEKNVIVESKKHFKKVVADTVALDHTINGYNIAKDFMMVDGDQTITGTKIFRRPVSFNSLNIGDGMIGDLNITELYENRLSLLVEDEVERDFEFSDDVIVEGDLIVHGTVGGLRIPYDVVLKNSTGPIANKIFTNRVKVDNLIVDGDAYASVSFGGIDLNDFYNDRVTLHTEQEIEVDVLIANSTIENLELTGLINEVNITEFANNVMSKTKDQDILAEKEFRGDVTVYGPITTINGINGVNLADLNNRAFKLKEMNIVEEPIEFEDINVENLSVTGLINGINLTYIAENSLKKKGLQYVTGTTFFNDGFHVEGDIDTGKINDMVIVEDVLLKTVPQTINGKFTLGSVGISGDLNVSGTVNGLDLSDIAPRLVTTDHETVVVSNVSFVSPIHVFQNIDVTGVVNGIDLKRLPDNLLLKKGDQEISGHKILRGNVTISGDIDATFVNGINWQEFLKDVVRIDIPQTIRTPKTFLEAEVVNLVSESAEVELINGKNLKDFLDDAVFIDVPTNITGPKVFKHTVDIINDLNADLINGLQLKTDVITLVCSEDVPGPQVITGQKTFENVTVLGDIIIEGKVNSLDLSALYLDTLLKDGNQTVTGLKTIIGETSFKGDVTSDTVNGIVLDKDLVTLHTKQDIYGPLVFSDVFVQGNMDVHGLVNNVNITKLAQDAVYLDTDDTIEGEYHLQTAIVANDVEVEDTVNYINITLFDRNVSSFWYDASMSLERMDKLSQENCVLVNYLQDILSKSYYILDAFIFYQELKFPASHINVMSPLELSMVYYDQSSNDASTIPSIWNPTSDTFMSYDDKQRTNIKKIIVQKIGITTIGLNIGVIDKDSYVSINGLVQNIPSGFQNADILMRGQEESIVALLYPARGVCEVYIITELQKPNPKMFNYGMVIVGKDPTSVAIFSFESSTYLAVSRLYNRVCKIYGRIGEEWLHIQNIPISASTSVKHFKYHNYDYLAFTNVAPVYETREPKSIQIFRNSGPNAKPFRLIQKIPFDDAKGFEVFEFGDLSELYLTTWNDTRVQVFRLEGESGLQSSYIIHGKCIKDVKALLIKDDIYLAVGQQNRQSEDVTSVLYKGLTKGTKYSSHNFVHC